MPCNATAVQVLSVNLAPLLIEDEAAHQTLAELLGCSVRHMDGILYFFNEEFAAVLGRAGDLEILHPSTIEEGRPIAIKIGQVLTSLAAAMAAKVIRAAFNGQIELDESPATYHIIV